MKIDCASDMLEKIDLAQKTKPNSYHEDNTTKPTPYPQNKRRRRRRRRRRRKRRRRRWSKGSMPEGDPQLHPPNTPYPNT